jgi:hypothetical protein
MALPGQGVLVVRQRRVDLASYNGSQGQPDEQESDNLTNFSG